MLQKNSAMLKIISAITDTENYAFKKII
jgi:hypothetical protein